MRILLSTLVLITATTLVTGCQSRPIEQFSRVQKGMSKAEVLEAAGNPRVARRWQGKDRWIYIYPDADEREVHFENGKAVYVGDKVRPKVSAAEQDRMNAEGLKPWEKEVLTKTPQYEEIE